MFSSDLLIMEEYKKQFAKLLAETGALFFKKGLRLKDGRPTPYFINMGKFNSGRLSYMLGLFFADMIFNSGIAKDIDIIFGPSYKGSAIALSTVISLWHKYGLDILFDYDRKEYKTYGEMSGSKGITVNNTLFDNCRIFIVDDVVSSMHTKYELIDKIKKEAVLKGITCNILGIGIAVDREQSSPVYDNNGNLLISEKGEDAIKEFMTRTGIPVYKLIGIKELITYLYQANIPVLINDKWGFIGKDIKENLDEYLRLYGVS